MCGFRYCDVYTVKSLNLECHVISKQDVDSNRFPKWMCNNLYVHFEPQDKYACYFVCHIWYQMVYYISIKKFKKKVLFLCFINEIIVDKLSIITSKLCCAIHYHIKHLFSLLHLMNGIFKQKSFNLLAWLWWPLNLQLYQKPVRLISDSLPVS